MPSVVRFAQKLPKKVGAKNKSIVMEHKLFFLVMDQRKNTTLISNACTIATKIGKNM